MQPRPVRHGIRDSGGVASCGGAGRSTSLARVLDSEMPRPPNCVVHVRRADAPAAGDLGTASSAAFPAQRRWLCRNGVKAGGRSRFRVTLCPSRAGPGLLEFSRVPGAAASVQFPGAKPSPTEFRGCGHSACEWRNRWKPEILAPLGQAHDSRGQRQHPASARNSNPIGKSNSTSGLMQPIPNRYESPGSFARAGFHLLSLRSSKHGQSSVRLPLGIDEGEPPS